MDKDYEIAVQNQLGAMVGREYALIAFVHALAEVMPPTMRAQLAQRFESQCETAKAHFVPTSLPDVLLKVFDDESAEIARILRQP
jgi:hypothetical protein